MMEVNNIEILHEAFHPWMESREGKALEGGALYHKEGQALSKWNRDENNGCFQGMVENYSGFCFAYLANIMIMWGSIIV